jgi:adenine-specific DNA methylase
VAALSTGKYLLLLSLAPASQRWNPQLARRSTLAALLTSRVGLLTDPDPKWLFAMPLEERAVLRQPLFYVRYQNSDNRLKQRLAEISARAIGKNSADGKPNIAPIVEILSRAHSQPAEVIPPVVFTSPATLALNETHSIPVQTSAPTPETVSMTRYPKRLIEVDLPIKRISAHARREKSIRHGHISTLHIWWARRPLAACRAVICAALWPDPADQNCPPAFVKRARELMLQWTTHERQSLLSTESRARFEAIRQDSKILDNPKELRGTLLDFIADFANWDSSTVPEFLATSRALTQAAHEALGGAPGTRPLVVDPFCGGGSIPLEALRVGADAFASDLNPIPVLLNKVVLEYIPKYGQRLADEVRKWGEWIKREAEKELAEFYPKDADGATPIAYLWARTIQCEGPGCGAEVPLIRSQWLAKTSHRSVALQFVPNNEAKRVDFHIIRKQRGEWVDQADPKIKIQNVNLDGTVKRGSATCPCCGYTTPVARVREQFKVRHGGTNDARLLCVVTIRVSESGRFYRLPTEADLENFSKASAELATRQRTHKHPLALVPDEPISQNEMRRISIPIYGMESWGDVFSKRQSLLLATLARLGCEAARRADPDMKDVLTVLFALALGRQADACSSLARWHTTREINTGAFGRQALGMVWDFCEINPFSGSSGGWEGVVQWIAKVCESQAEGDGHNSGQVQRASAAAHPLADDIASAWITDPPYYDAVPYAHLSDYFYVWLRRMLNESQSELFGFKCVPKDEEIVVDRPHYLSQSKKDVAFYERELTKAFAEGRRMLRPDGIGAIVFASKTTSSWEAILKAVVDAGWIITGSWPIDTEMEARVAAQGQARLASSVHLVCRPRESPDGSMRTDEIGDWRDVLQALPIRIHEWMPRLAEEGVVGADAIFACLGPALEIFSRYSRVEKANGETVTLKEYLEQVWAAVAKEALALVFKDADTTGFEADARLTAMWLWTLNAGNTDATNGDSTEDDDSDDESESGSKKAKVTGFVLEYDAARKIAQGLGANLENLASLVELSGETARLLPVGERARHLFGKDEGHVTTARKKKVPQLDLFKVLEQADDGGTTFGKTKVEHHGETVLDRIHQSMILFAAGRSEAMKRFLVEDGAGRDPRFWRLAQALSALYPSHTEEKRWVDGVLARKKGLGF